MRRMADGNKPINVGDPSYIYKGVYNPIYWIGEEPYRPRVETLVIKDGRYVYADIEDNIEEIPSDLRYKHYSVPGGSLDADSTKIEQAEAETNEEALVKVSFLYNTGISYYQLYEPGFIARGGDTPLEYVGSISDVFIGVYAGPYDKSLVDEKDLDPPMAEHGKFHEITAVAKYLRKEHIEALLASQFVHEDVKVTLRLNRNDVVNESTGPIVVPDRFIYHASTHWIEEFKPMALDLGNLMNPPGWSTFCHESYQDALVFGMLRSIQKWSGINNLNINPVFNRGHIVFTLNDFNKFKDSIDIKNKFKYYLYTIDSEPLRIELGNDSTIREYTFRESGVKPYSVENINLSLYDLKEYVDIVDEANPEEYNDYKDLFIHEYNKEDTVRTALVNAVKNGELKPGDDVEEYMRNNGLSFDNDDISLPDLSIGIDEPLLDAINIYSFLEESYPVECYGLPDRKAYPMPDEKHVRSAIRFFNYAKPEEEKELASNINKKIKEFKIKDISVGKSNRFKKYYKPITENFSLKDYLSALESVNNQIEKNPTYALYEQAKNVIRLMVINVEEGNVPNLSNDQISPIVNQCYAALAEINQNQMELMSPTVESDTRSVGFKKLIEASLFPVLEADDDEDKDDTNDDETETATDYTAMADEAEKENEESDEPTDDGDNSTEDATDTSETGEDETPDNAGNDEDSETATDYTAMADDAGADTDDTPDTGGEGNNDAPEEPEDPATDVSDDGGDSDTTDANTDDGSGDTIDDTGDATDYTAMADDAGAGDDTGEDTGDGTDSTDTTSDDTSSNDTSTDTEETDENNNRYDNKELKNYFLLNSFLSLHETVVDLLDSASGVILPTPDANGIMSKVVKNLKDVKSFIEKFIQFQFNEKDYTFNLYYYNILTNALRMNLKLLEEAVKMGEAKTTKKKQLKEE